VVTTSALNQPIDVTLFKNFSWGEYDQEIYRGICGYIKDNNIEGNITIFLSGKMISVGAKSIMKSIEQLKYANRLLINNNFVKNNQIQQPRVRNIVATINLEKRIDFESISKILGDCDYNPEKFPAIIYRDKIATSLIFKSGKIVVSGAKTEESIMILADKIKKILT
jgi:transcription initiation factor TFIID TATA-box-binding protein